MSIKDIRIGSVKSARVLINTQVCRVDIGYGAERMTHIGTTKLVNTGNVLFMNGHKPGILAAVSGDKIEIIYVSIYDNLGEVFTMIDANATLRRKTVRFSEYIQADKGKYIIDGLTTNDKCQVCWRGEPIYGSEGVIKVSSLCNAQIGTL
jgi:hypothetical protein